MSDHELNHLDPHTGEERFDGSTVPWVRRWRPALYMLGGILTGALLIGVLTVIVNTFTITSAIREQQRTNTGTFDLLTDCVTPEGKCYTDGQRRTGEAVGMIGQLSVYASACAAELPATTEFTVTQRVRQISRCVEELVDEAEKRRSEAD